MLARTKLAEVLLGFVLIAKTGWATGAVCTNSEGLAVDGADSTFMAGGVDKDGAGEATIGGDRMTLYHNSGYSLMKSCQKEWDPREFKVLRLLGRTFSFIVDLSQAGCACNVAVYLIQAPARDPSGNFSVGECPWSPYYCDANRVCGQWCPELDIMEANDHVFSSTLHKCDAPDANGHYYNCERGGCGHNTRSLGGSAYGPGSGFTIDTTRPFEVVTEFHGSATSFTGLKTKLRQMHGEEERLLVLENAACGGAAGALAAAMAEGMVLRITYWGSDAQTMAWLDSPPCGFEACGGERTGPAVIRSFRITPPLPPEPRSEKSLPPPPAISFPGWEQSLVNLAIAGMLLVACGMGVVIGRQTLPLPSAEAQTPEPPGPARTLSSGSLRRTGSSKLSLLRLAEGGGVSSTPLAD